MNRPTLAVWETPPPASTYLYLFIYPRLARLNVLLSSLQSYHHAKGRGVTLILLSIQVHERSKSLSAVGSISGLSADGRLQLFFSFTDL
jgi:hypothetical protein